MTAINTAISLIINVFIGLYIYILLLRFLLQKLGARWYNPFSQFIVKITDPIVNPTQRFIPGFRGFDLSIIVISLILEIISLLLLFKLKTGIMPGLGGTMLMALGQLGSKFVNIYFYALIIGAIISWAPNLQHSPLAEIVNIITYPVLYLMRRIIPPIAGLDLSPIFLMVILLLINILIFTPLFLLGSTLAY